MTDGEQRSEIRTWGGRFEGDMDTLTRDYTAGVDAQLYEFDIQGSIAHARMLGAQGIIPAEDADALVTGLARVLDDFRTGKVTWRPELEDIHTHVEVLLHEYAGEAAGRLHTARSRNDQVSLLNRLLVRSLCDRAASELHRLVSVLCDLGELHAGAPMPGYTHVQRAQPVTLGHHLLAYGEMFARDRSRFLDCRTRVNLSPLGAGALAGSPYPLDREAVAFELGFVGVTRNSLDATADRDYAAEFIAACAMAQVHASRFAEDIILWASAEFGFVKLPDGFATGSSMMPQKKNADVAELARGRTGRVVGELVNILIQQKGLPLAYNRDLQEDKAAILNAAEALIPTVTIFAAMIPALEFQLPRMRQAAGENFSLATDVADYLVKKGMPFREAHAVVGGLVRECETRGCELAGLPFAAYQAASDLFEADILELSVESALDARDIPGAAAPRQVRIAAAGLRAALGPDR